MQDDPRCAEVLGIEEGGELHLYQLITPPHAPKWRSYYSLWAKIAPMDKTRSREPHYRLSHLALSSQWQELDVEGSFEYCVRQIMENRYHLFFG
jgi:hypothetical protein